MAQRKKGSGAPKGNLNAQKHGEYSALRRLQSAMKAIHHRVDILDAQLATAERISDSLKSSSAARVKKSLTSSKKTAATKG